MTEIEQLKAEIERLNKVFNAQDDYQMFLEKNQSDQLDKIKQLEKEVENQKELVTMMQSACEKAYQQNITDQAKLGLKHWEN